MTLHGKELADALDLSGVNCEELVRGVYQALWVQPDGGFNPSKEWSSDTLTEIAGLFIEAGILGPEDIYE